MKKISGFSAALCAAILLSSCISSVPSDIVPTVPPTDADYQLTLDFTQGTGLTNNIIYASWIEDAKKSFVSYIYVCERLDCVAFMGSSSYLNISNKKTCPYWRTNLYETALDDDVDFDAVSGATKRSQNFTESITLPAGSPSRFTVYFECECSYDPNGWWSDQPAILYAADVDLSDGDATATFDLGVQGWARNAGGGSGGNVNVFSGNPADSDIGALQTEMRYITNAPNSDGTGFGDAYGTAVNSSNGRAYDASTMVGSLTLTATKL